MFSFCEQVDNVSERLAKYKSADNIDDIVKAIEDEMNQAARELAFEKAAELRDQIKALKKIMLYFLFCKY